MLGVNVYWYSARCLEWCKIHQHEAPPTPRYRNPLVPHQSNYQLFQKRSDAALSHWYHRCTYRVSCEHLPNPPIFGFGRSHKLSFSALSESVIVNFLNQAHSLLVQLMGVVSAGFLNSSLELILNTLLILLLSRRMVKRVIAF